MVSCTSSVRLHRMEADIISGRYSSLLIVMTGITYNMESLDSEDCPTEYEMKTYNSEKEMKEAGAEMTHWGAVSIMPVSEPSCSQFIIAHTVTVSIRAVRCMQHNEGPGRLLGIPGSYGKGSRMLSASHCRWF